MRDSNILCSRRIFGARIRTCSELPFLTKTVDMLLVELMPQRQTSGHRMIMVLYCK